MVSTIMTEIYLIAVLLQEEITNLLMLSTLGKIFSRRYFETFFLIFPENRFDISCKLSPLSPLETIGTKCQILLSGGKKKKKINLSSAEFAQSGKGLTPKSYSLLFNL